MLQDQELEEAIADAVDIGEKEVLGGKGIICCEYNGLSDSVDLHNWICLSLGRRKGRRVIKR